MSEPTQPGRPSYALPVGLILGDLLLAGALAGAALADSAAGLAGAAIAALVLLAASVLVVAGFVIGLRALWARRPVVAGTADMGMTVFLALISMGVVLVAGVQVAKYVHYLPSYGFEEQLPRILWACLAALVGAGALVLSVAPAWFDSRKREIAPTDHSEAAAPRSAGR
jgi:hypothetical protein